MGKAFFCVFGLVILVSTAVAQNEIPREYHPKTAQEFIAAVEEANSNPNELAMIFLDGTYIFVEIATGEDNVSPLPPLKALAIRIIARPGTRIIWNGLGGSERVALLSRESRKEDEDDVVDLFFEWVHLVGTLFGPPETQRSESLESRDHRTKTSDPEERVLIQGFDSIFEGHGGTLVLNGIDAVCKQACITADDTRVIVVNSSLQCGSDCLRIKDPVAGTHPIDFDSQREAVAQFALSSSDRAVLLNQISQSERIFDDYDIAVVNSRLESPGNTVAINRGSAQTVDRALIDASRLLSTGSSGRALSLKVTGDKSIVHNSVLSSPGTSDEALDFVYGELNIRNSYLQGGEQALELTDGDAILGHTALTLGPGIVDVVCNSSFTTDKAQSSGYNIVVDDSCDLQGPGDLQNTDPGLLLPVDGSLIPEFETGSLALDGGGRAVTNGALPCSPSDMLGLPRPQDGNGDGIAECDVGPVEMQAGEDIGAPQSGAFFDVDRDGEGIFVEMLGNGKAVLYLFSYRPDGRAFWAQGVGKVVGNGIVIPRTGFITTLGPTFGADYDPADVQWIPFADLSVSLPGCDRPTSAGVLSIRPNPGLGFPPLLSRMSRLTSIVSCEGTAPGPGVSGSFYDPTHNGEGIIVQAVSPTEVVVIWFTYDPDGNQEWVLGQGAINGNVITVTDAFSQTGPIYGPAFDSGDIVRTTWGSFTVTFSNNCSSADLDYASVLPRFGSGMQNMQRLTNLAGVTCGLDQ